MLRIGMTPQGPGPVPPEAGPQPPQVSGPPQGIPPELAAALGSPDAKSPKTTRSAIDKVDPTTAGYLDPDKGPFMCSNCDHFQGKGSCEIVDGSIDPNGCCNLFDGDHDKQDAGALEGGQDDGSDQLDQ